MSTSKDAYNLGYAEHQSGDDFEDCTKRAKRLYPSSDNLQAWYEEGWEDARKELNKALKGCGDI